MQSHEPASLVSWDDYRILLAVAQAGSFQLAGRELGVATSTVSRRLSAWEHRLGVRIVDRRSAGVVLTEAGSALAAAARLLQEHVATVEQSVAQHDQAASGTVRVTAGDGMGDVVVAALVALRAAHPTLDVELLVDRRTYDLAKRQADLAIRAVRPVGAGLFARKLGVFRLGFYASPEYLARRGAPARLHDLSRHDVVGLSTGLARNPAQRWLTELGLTQASFRASDVALAVTAVRAGLGIGAVAHALARLAGLRRVLPSLETGPYPVWLVRHRDTRGKRNIELVADFLYDRLRSATE